MYQCKITAKNQRLSAGRQGFIQIIPMVILAIVAVSSFVIINKTQTDQQDVRSRAGITCTRKTIAGCAGKTYKIQDGICEPENCFTTSGSANSVVPTSKPAITITPMPTRSVNTPTIIPTSTNAPHSTSTPAPTCIADGKTTYSGGPSCCPGTIQTDCVSQGTFSYCYCRTPPTNPSVTAPTSTVLSLKRRQLRLNQRVLLQQDQSIPR